MDVQFLLGRRVKYRRRTVIVVNHEAVTDVVARTITLWVRRRGRGVGGRARPHETEEEEEVAGEEGLEPSIP
jgi:hypothetical protein